jgi:hypothetical protein
VLLLGLGPLLLPAYPNHWEVVTIDYAGKGTPWQVLSFSIPSDDHQTWLDLTHVGTSFRVPT